MKKQFEEHFSNPELFYDPKHPKFQCTLQAQGIDFDPDAFLAESKLSLEKGLDKGIIGLPDEIKEKLKRREIPDDAQEKIEQGFLTAEEFFEAFQIFESPFLLIRISEAANYASQVEQATLFLKKYSEDLKKWSTYPGVETFAMQFLTKDYNPRDDENFTKEFYGLCAEIGIRGVSIG